MDDSEYLWRMYNEHTTQGRHHELQRTGVSTVVLALAGAVVAFLSQPASSELRWPMAAFLVALGLFGAGFSLKQTERTRLHISIAGAYGRELESRLQSPQHKHTPLDTINSDARRQHNLDWNWRTGEDDRNKGIGRSSSDRDPLFPLYWFFIALNLLVAVLGVAIWVFG
jgi:hypothetical protein